MRYEYHREYVASRKKDLPVLTVNGTRGSQLTPLHLSKLIKIDKMDENQ